MGNTLHIHHLRVLRDIAHLRVLRDIAHLQTVLREGESTLRRHLSVLREKEGTLRRHLSDIKRGLTRNEAQREPLRP